MPKCKSAKQIMLEAISESDFQDEVIEYAHRLKWSVAHFRTVVIVRNDGSTYCATPAAADGEGFPDLMLVRDRAVFMELKSMKGRRSPKQILWGDWLLAAGQEYYCFKPSDWAQIEEILK